MSRRKGTANQGVLRDSPHHVTDICSEFSPSPLTSLTRGSSRVAEVAGAEDSSVSGDFPPKMRLFVKDWVAQWDPLYSAWFYYHPQPGQMQSWALKRLILIMEFGHLSR